MTRTQFQCTKLDQNDLGEIIVCSLASTYSLVPLIRILFDFFSHPVIHELSIIFEQFTCRGYNG